MSCWPTGIPAPHSSEAVPGLTQVVTPPGLTFQPWLESSLEAADTLKGYGSVLASVGVYGFEGVSGMVPYDGAAAPW